MARLLIRILAVTRVACLALLGGVVWLYLDAEISTVGRLDFENPIEIPPLLEPRTDDRGRKVFNLELREGTSELLPGKRTETWGANGTYLAPTLRATWGDEVLVKVKNRLSGATTTIHWHGMHLPAAADGGPHQTIEPGGTWSPAWRIDQPAATLWYHPHPHPKTADQIYRGITGIFILDDPQAGRLPLPDSYGVDDVPLIIQDKKFEKDGSLDFSKGAISPAGLLGDEILVNGTHEPHLDVVTKRVRLRLLSASNARVYNVGFADDRPFELIATDGGLIDAPQQTQRIQLSPGERAEVVAEFEPGEEVVLRSFEPDLGTTFFDGRFSGADDSFDLLEIRAAHELAPAPKMPERLARHEQPEEKRGRQGAALRALTPRLDQRPRDGHEPHRRGGRDWSDRGLGGREQFRYATQFPRPRRAVSPARLRGRRAAATARRAQGHRLRAAERDGAIRGRVRRLRRPSPGSRSARRAARPCRAPKRARRRR